VSVSEMTGSIRVEYSNRIERMVDSLAGALDRGRNLGRIFEPPRVVVPNRNVEKFLKFELADRFGVVGDIEFSTLEAWLRDALPDEVVPLEDQRLTSAILGLLCSEAFLERHEEMAPVRSYLGRDDEPGDGRGRALRVYQLAERVAANFREYGYSRTRMLDRWTESDELYTEPAVAAAADGGTSPYRENERWQRCLWRALFGADGLLDRAGDDDESYVLFSDYWRHLDPEDDEDLDGPIHLFALSHVAPVYGQIFERLARVVELRFYVLNPCRHFWEDVVYEREEEVVEAPADGGGSGAGDLQLPLEARGSAVPAATPIEPRSFAPENPSDTPLALTLWGRAGRDHIHMLNRLAGYSFAQNWTRPVDQPAGDSPTLLEAFQTDVLEFEQAAHSPRDPKPDDSVRFIEAPGVRRELEAIADEIWSLVLAHEDVDFNDIAVIVNPRRREEYQMHLEAVFEEVRGIPFNLVDVERGDGSRLLQAVELLIELPLGEFDRRELGSLLAHPNLAANYPEADPDEWSRWCEELAIFRGANAGDLEGTHVDRDLYNWDQGITRLVLGSFLEETAGRQGYAEPFEIGGESYVPEAPIEMASTASAGRWIELVRQLIGEAKATRDREDSLGGWCRWMAHWIEGHLAPADANEKAEMAGYLDALRSAAEMDLSTAGDADRVPYRAAVEFARRQLASQTYERGHYLATGVVVSSFVPQRPIPFEVIFMTGLGSEDFPGSSPRTPIDLRTARWEQGDLWQRDRERYMFFETVLSARRRVTCSWVARNPVTGEDLEPSSVVREFQYILEQYVGEEGLDELVREHPLRRFDGAYFEDGDEADDKEAGVDLSPTFHPSAREERRAARLREVLFEATGASETRDLEVSAFIDGDHLRETFGVVDEPDRPDDPDDEARTARELPFSALRKFLESPLQAWARYRLGLRDDDEEALLEETDEPFELSTLETVIILRQAFRDAATAGPVEGAVEGALRRRMDRAALEGRAPTGAYGRVAHNRLESVGAAWADQLSDEPKAERVRYRFGAPRGDEKVRACEAIRMEIERGERRQILDLTGDTTLAAPDIETLYIPTRKKPYRIGWRRTVRGWIQGLVLSAAEIFESERFEVVLLHKQAGREPVRVTFEENAPDRATAQLETLAEQLWFEVHAYRFALSEIENVLGEDFSIDPGELRGEIWDADGEHGHTSDQYGPVADVHRYDIPSGDPEKLAALVRRRIGPFVRGVREAEL